MITPTDIHRKALHHFYQWLGRIAEGKPDYTALMISRVGDKKNDTDRWDYLTEISNHSKTAIGYGYRLELEPPLPNSKNKQSRIRAIVFDTENDLLRYLEKEQEFKSFIAANALVKAIPALDAWRIQHVRELVQYAQQWPQLLRVVRFFEENPSPGLPIRLLPIAGVDTKFIEQYNGILCQLLDKILNPASINSESRLFAKRYGLPEHEPSIACAWNDATIAQYFRGFTRTALPADQLAANPLPVQKVIVVENKSSMEQLLPIQLPDTLIIFGGGFGVSPLKNCTWFNQVSLYYWGDIDTHGLSILSQFRRLFSNVIPIFMDDATLEAHQSACVKAAAFIGDMPAHLTTDEQILFEKLRQNDWRLEQERIGAKWLLAGLVALA